MNIKSTNFNYTGFKNLRISTGQEIGISHLIDLPFI